MITVKYNTVMMRFAAPSRNQRHRDKTILHKRSGAHCCNGRIGEHFIYITDIAQRLKGVTTNQKKGICQERIDISNINTIPYR